jgi:hypothetical protein
LLWLGVRARRYDIFCRLRTLLRPLRIYPSPGPCVDLVCLPAAFADCRTAGILAAA